MPSSVVEMNRTTVVIPNWNGMKWLQDCLQSLSDQSEPGFDTLVVDNGSTDGSVAFIKACFPAVKLIGLPANLGFAKAANIGIAQAMTPYIALLNTDTRPDPDWLSSLVARMDRAPPEVGGLSSQMLRFEDRRLIDDAGDTLSWYGAATKRGHGDPATAYGEESEVFSVCAGAGFYRRAFLEKAGGFDETFFAYLEDVDLGLRGRLLGFRFLYVPGARVLHQGHGSGLPTARYVALMACNRLVLFAKNVPLRLLLRHAPRLFYGQIWFLVAHGHAWASLKGYGSFIARLPSTLRQRRRIQDKMVLEPTQIDRLLSRTPPAPLLSALLSHRLCRLGSKVKALFAGGRPA
jgi:GT2 family glycosyltransferase